MQLENVAHYNDFSDELRNKLTEKLRSYGKQIRFKFDISKENPDPGKYNGDIVYPNIYTLDPCVFNIIDPYEKRAGKAKSKRVGLVSAIDEKGLPSRFEKIRIKAADKGILTYQLTEGSDDFYKAMMALIHPKLRGGDFADNSKHQVFSIIDEDALATSQREERSIRKKAMDIAEQMSLKEITNFADAMMWDSTEDELRLRNKVEELAEKEPKFFNDLVEGKNVEYRATVKQALDKKLIEFDPAEYKFIWCGNKQTIAILSPVGDKSENEKLADWLMISSSKNVYDKLKSLLK